MNMNAQKCEALASSEIEKNYKLPINRTNNTVSSLDVIHIISDDSETEQNINNSVKKPIKSSSSINEVLRSRCTTSTITIQPSLKRGRPGAQLEESYNRNTMINKKKLYSKGLIERNNHSADLIEVQSHSTSEKNEPEMLIVPSPVPLDPKALKTSSEKTISDFDTTNPSSLKKFGKSSKSPSPLPPFRPVLKTNIGNLEKYLANLEKRFSKLSSEDKVLNWKFSSDVDDVEDFVELEKNKKVLKAHIRNNNNSNHNNMPSRATRNIKKKCRKPKPLHIQNISKYSIRNMKNSNPLKNLYKINEKIDRGNDNVDQNLDNGSSNANSSNESVPKDNQHITRDSFKIPSVPRKYIPYNISENNNDSCGYSDCELLTDDHKEEFCKYLGLGTKSQNDDLSVITPENYDSKRRSLRVKRLQILHKNNPKKSIEKQIQTPEPRNTNEEDNKDENEVEKLNQEIKSEIETIFQNAINTENSFKKQKEIEVTSNKQVNGEIKNQHSISPHTFTPRPFTPQRTMTPKISTLETEFPHEKSKIKILCTLNSNTISAGSPSITTTPKSPLLSKSLMSCMHGNIGSPVSVRSKPNSRKVSSKNSNISDDRSSHNNHSIKSCQNNKSLIIVKNSYEPKKNSEITNEPISTSKSIKNNIDSIIKTKLELLRKPIKDEISEDEDNKDKIKILEKITYSPKKLKDENTFFNFDNFKNLSPSVKSISHKKSIDLKEKIKIECSYNYAIENIKPEFSRNIEDISNFKTEPIKNSIESNPCFVVVKKLDTDTIQNHSHVIEMRNVWKKTRETVKENSRNSRKKHSKKKLKKRLIKNPSSLKFFRLVLKPKSKQKLVKNKVEEKIAVKRQRRHQSNSEKSVNLFSAAKIVTKEEICNAQQLLPNSIVTTSDNEIVSDLNLNLLPNPLRFEDGDVLHAYYEKEHLIVVQQNTISFWKYSQIVQILGQQQEWQLLGEIKRNTNDDEVNVPFKNRLLLNDTIPVYIEVRGRQLPYANRECNLLSPYVNVYYFSAVKNVVQHHSIQLDSVKSLSSNVLYTAITNSRYFILSWKQETQFGAIRTGLCKYALTPDLDTLASIRDFKHLRHTLNSLECIDDEKMIGFGDRQITIWDYRTGDVLTNLDLDIPIGRNLGSIIHSLESDSYLIIYQLIHSEEEESPDDELTFPHMKIFAITLSLNSPSYRLIYNHKLPIQFDKIKSSLNLNNYIIATALTGEELWMLSQQPQRLMFMNDEISTSLKRFYTTLSENFVEITGDYLNIKTIHENLMNFINT